MSELLALVREGVATPAGRDRGAPHATRRHLARNSAASEAATGSKRGMEFAGSEALREAVYSFLCEEVRLSEPSARKRASGEFQGSCRMKLIYAADFSRSGFSLTTSSRSQFRMPRAQRSGFRFRAAA